MPNGSRDIMRKHTGDLYCCLIEESTIFYSCNKLKWRDGLDRRSEAIKPSFLSMCKGNNKERS
jgi:hypothetical protein